MVMAEKYILKYNMYIFLWIIFLIIKLEVLLHSEGQTDSNKNFATKVIQIFFDNVW